MYVVCPCTITRILHMYKLCIFIYIHEHYYVTYQDLNNGQLTLILSLSKAALFSKRLKVI